MNDFWNSWEEVISELRTSNSSELAEQLQKSRLYLNGLTDGWHDFHKTAEQVIAQHAGQLTEQQIFKRNSTLKAAWEIVTRR